MIKIKSIAFILTFFHLYVITSDGPQKRYEESVLEKVPKEIFEKIIFYLPLTEQNKIALVNKSAYKLTHDALQEHRHRAFRNYLLYPFLSSFVGEPVSERLGVQCHGTEERDTLRELLQSKENKIFLDSVLLKDAHRNYFGSGSWPTFFNLKSKFFNVRPGELDEHCIVQIVPCAQEHEAHKEINKIFVIRISDDLFSHLTTVEDCARHCADVLNQNMREANKIKTKDRVRIIIDDIDAHNELSCDVFRDPNALALKFEFFNVLIANIVKPQGGGKKTPKIDFIKTLDLTAYDPSLVTWSDPMVNVIKQIPRTVQLCVPYLPSLFLEKSTGEMPNIIFKPDIFVPIAHQEEDKIVRDDHLIDNLELFCKNGFALSLLNNIRSYLFNDEGSFERDKRIIRMLSKYISPFTRDFLDKTILDKLFYKSTEAIFPIISDELSRKIIELFLLIMKEVGIDPNKYIITPVGVTPLYAAFMLLKSALHNHIHGRLSLVGTFRSIDKAQLFIMHIAQKEVDLSSEIGNKVMKSFFENMYFFGSPDQASMFDSLTDNEIVPEGGKNIYQRVTEEGDTLLHRYFKYSKCFNRDIILKILDKLPSDMINTRNEKGESIFECYIRFLYRHRAVLSISPTWPISIALPDQEFFVVKLLDKGLDLGAGTSSQQTYVDFIRDLIDEGMQVGSAFPDLSKRQAANILKSILNIILPSQGRIEKRKTRW